LLWLAELIEEHSRTAKVVGVRAIWVSRRGSEATEEGRNERERSENQGFVERSEEAPQARKRSVSRGRRRTAEHQSSESEMAPQAKEILKRSENLVECAEGRASVSASSSKVREPLRL
jgi:hypothetical protein